MAALVKVQAGALVAALGLATLPLREQESRRIPVIGAVRLASDGDGLIVAATSFDGTITTRIEAEADGEMAVPLARLAALVRNFPADAEITITADDTATVNSGRSMFRLPVLPTAGLLEPLTLGDETGRVELEAKIARDLFSRPVFAAAADTSRPYLCGVFLHSIGDNLCAVSTDSYRIARVSVPATSALSTDRLVTISSEMVRTINRLLGTTSGVVTLRRSERLFAVEGAAFVLVTRRVDCSYPDYERWIPADGPNVVTVSRARLTESIKRFAAVADPQIKTHFVRLRWDADGLHLSASDGSADRIAADVEGEAATAVQIHHLTDLVGALRGDSVRLSVGGPGAMILVTDPDDKNFFAGQMPRRAS